MDWRCWSLLVALVVPIGCRSFDEGRVAQTLNQRGFGRKYIGDSNEILTIGIGDSISIADPNIVQITGRFTVRMDGVIETPVGEVFIAGFSTAEIGEQLNQRYRKLYKDPQIQVAVEMVQSKFYFLTGELSSGATGTGVQRVAFSGNTTVFDAVMKSPVPATADLSDIYVIRADPVHPLVIPVDLQKMIYYGDARDNIPLREDDIVVVNPNFAGYIKNFVNLLLEPVKPVLQFAVSVRNIKTIYESFKNDENFFVGGGSSGGGNFGGTGGFNSGFATSGSSTTTGNGGGNGGGNKGNGK